MLFIIRLYSRPLFQLYIYIAHHRRMRYYYSLFILLTVSDGIPEHIYNELLKLLANVTRCDSLQYAYPHHNNLKFIEFAILLFHSYTSLGLF